MTQLKVSYVRFEDKEVNITYLVAHPPGINPDDVCIRLLGDMPEIVRKAREAETLRYQRAEETFPKRLSDWEKSYDICDKYEADRAYYQQAQAHADSVKMVTGEAPPEIDEPERPDREHYPLPPKPERPVKPDHPPFSGKFSQCVQALQAGDLENRGLKVVGIYPGLKGYVVSPGI